MNEKRFKIVTGYIKDDNEKFVADFNSQIGQRTILNLLNHYALQNEELNQKIKNKNEYQQVLESKIRRLKDRIKILEKSNK